MFHDQTFDARFVLCKTILKQQSDRMSHLTSHSLLASRPTSRQVSDKLIERVVKHYTEVLGIEKLTPHGLRASFITLSIESGANTHPDAIRGHEDPRTTELYLTRKLNLDDNAVDYLKL
jgi:integrase